MTPFITSRKVFVFLAAGFHTSYVALVIKILTFFECDVDDVVRNKCAKCFLLLFKYCKQPKSEIICSFLSLSER